MANRVTGAELDMVEQLERKQTMTKRLFSVSALVFTMCVLSTGGVVAQDATLRILTARYHNIESSGDHSCNAVSFVRRMCRGRTSCEFLVDNHMCGDPSPHNAKQLDVAYVCGKSGSTETASAHDSTTMTLSCE